MSSPDRPTPRRRLTRDQRGAQLLETAWRLIREEGADALTLGRLAERAGVAKPVAYDHFATREGLFLALYQEFDARQHEVMAAALEASAPDLRGKAAAVAESYVDCVLLQGREIPGVLAALEGSPQMEAAKRVWRKGFLESCGAALAPYAAEGAIATAGLWAMLGAAESLSRAAATGDLTPDEAKAELLRIILSMAEV